NAVRQTVSQPAGDLSVSDAQTLDQRIDLLNSQPRLIADISATFGSIALLLAAIGVYAVLSHNVARRRNEFGIRMALGADRRKIVSQVLGRAGRTITAGLIAGVLAAAFAARILAAQLYGVNPSGPRWSMARYEHVDSATQLYGIGAMDLPTIALTIGILLGIGLIAAWIPAARAAQIDPASALRQE